MSLHNKSSTRCDLYILLNDRMIIFCPLYVCSLQSSVFVLPIRLSFIYRNEQKTWSAVKVSNPPVNHYALYSLFDVVVLQCCL